MEKDRYVGVVVGHFYREHNDLCEEIKVQVCDDVQKLEAWLKTTIESASQTYRILTAAFLLDPGYAVAPLRLEVDFIHSVVAKIDFNPEAKGNA